MALIQCPDCGKEVSELAPVCIHCGRPLPARPATTEEEIKEDGATVLQSKREPVPAEIAPTEPPRGTDPIAPESRITTSNGIAAFCGVLIPGLGHLVQGRAVAALAIFGSSAICWGIAVANLGDRLAGKLVAQPAVYVALVIQFLGVLSVALWRGPTKQKT